jgi:hypothetical protein
MLAAIQGPGMTVTGCTSSCGVDAIGTFTENTGLFGTDFSAGVVLTTGLATQAMGPNNIGSLSASFGLTGDADLATLNSGQLNDVCSVTLSIKTVGTLTWKFSFGSEEYEEYVNSQFNDVFGFFFSGPNFPKKNLAMAPGNNAIVSINSINHLVNTNNYVRNINNEHPQIQYDGFTTGLFVKIMNLLPGETYTVKLAIADVADFAYDSGVFLSAFATPDPFIGVTSPTITVECGPIPQSTQTTGFCSTPTITFVDTRVDGSCANKYTITRVYTAKDTCSNTRTVTQTIIVQDTTAPVLSGVPASLTVECGSVPAAPQVTVTDSCDTTVPSVASMTETRTNGACLNTYTLTRTWTATDGCGNKATGTQVITVKDTKKPILVGVPSDITVECSNVPAALTLTATDGCDANPTVSFSEVRTNGACVNTYLLTRTWTAKDECGNTVTATQKVNVKDSMSPFLIGVPSDTSVECNAFPIAPTVTSNDNCGSDPTVSLSEKYNPGKCENYYSWVRTWSATDICGNTATASQTIVVSDTTAPIFHGVPNDVVVSIDNIPPIQIVTATDGCDSYGTKVTFSETTQKENCPYLSSITRTWVAEDLCGNKNTASHTIKIKDSQSPTFDVNPSDTTVECSNIPPVPTVTATDDSGVTPIITFSDPRTDGDCPNRYTKTRTWTATDACGNAASISQKVNVQDTVPPVLNGVPADLTVECDSVPVAATVTATDSCGGAPLIVELSEDISDKDCENKYTITRTWSAKDSCGNPVSASQTILVQDTIPPVIDQVPAEVTVECDAVPVFGTVVVTDNCDNDPDVETDEDREDGDCPYAYTLTRTWTAKDSCGNTVPATQIIHVQDTTAPVLSGVPSEITVDCDDVPEIATVTATDNSGEIVTVDSTEDREDGDCPNAYTLTRTWTSEDSCGNTVSASQIIHVRDITLPVLSGVPADDEVECSSVPEPAEVTADDNCDTTCEVEFDEVPTPGYCPHTYKLTRTWTSTDSCGNTATASQTLHVEDTIAPVLHGVPEDDDVECDSVPEPPTVTAIDDCDESPSVDFSEIRTNGDCIYQYILTRTWTATDACGNFDTATQIIHVHDTSDPVLHGIPEDTTAECDSVPSVPTVTASDNCGTPTLDFEELIEDGTCPNCYDIIRTWTATDACGNTAEGSQTISIVDTTAPVLYGVPKDLNLQCATDVPVAPTTITASDNCDDAEDIVIALNEVLKKGSCDNRFTLERTWTATDSCGNSKSQKQVITVYDNTPPQITNLIGSTISLYPPNHSFWCAKPCQLWSYTDNCPGAVTPTFKNCLSTQCDEAPCATYPSQNGDGSFPGDCKMVDDSICFRAERVGIDDNLKAVRSYLATDTFSDVCGNTAEVGVTVTVPHDKQTKYPTVSANYNPKGRN